MRWFVAGCLILLVGIVIWLNDIRQQPQSGGTMQLISSAFKDQELIPRQFSCDGAGQHPPLTITGVPDQTKSLVLIVRDPDAPSGEFIHWLIWNIDPKTTDIPDGRVPAGATEGHNSAGQTGWFAPCPPSGRHRYIFDMYALRSHLSLSGTSQVAELKATMADRILDQATLTGLYQRS